MESQSMFVLLVASVFVASGVAEITVHSAGKLPSPLVQTASVYDEQSNSIYIFGGLISNHHFVNDVLKFNIETAEIETISKFPHKSIFGGSAHVDRKGNFYYIGGLTNDDGFGVYSSAIYKMTPTDRTPVEIAQLPTALSGHCSFYDGINGFFVMGGANLSSFNENFYYYSPIANSTLTFRPEHPIMRTMAPCVGFKSSAYLFGGYGGYEGDAPKYYSQIIKSNPMLKTVEETRVPFDRPIAGASAVITNSNDVYIIGGEAHSSPEHHTLHRFSPITEELEVLKPEGLSAGILDASSVYVPSLNRIYIIGGYQADSGLTDGIIYLQL